MTPHIRENIFTWLVDWSLVTIMGNTPPPRGPPTTMTTMTTRTKEKKAKRMRTRTKNRRSSENPTNSAAHSRLRQVEFAYGFRAAGPAWLLRRFREVPERRSN